MSSRLPRRGTGPPVGEGAATDAAAWVVDKVLEGVAAVAAPVRVPAVPAVTAGRVAAVVPEVKALRDVLAIMTEPVCSVMMNRTLTGQPGNAIPRRDCSAWMPGRVLPSSHSRNAPPAVET